MISGLECLFVLISGRECLSVLISGQAFVFYFPFIFALNALSGVKYLGAIVLCEWMNLNLKWSENKNFLKMISSH
jgi:hypothetical protein